MQHVHAQVSAGSVQVIFWFSALCECMPRFPNVSSEAADTGSTTHEAFRCGVMAAKGTARAHAGKQCCQVCRQAESNESWNQLQFADDGAPAIVVRGFHCDMARRTIWSA